MRPELGTKRICPTTGKKFYDLGKSPVVSPYSGEVVPIDAPSRSYARVAAPVVARKEAPAEEDEADGPELVSLDEVEAEEADQDADHDAGGDGALDVEDGAEQAEDDSLVVDEDDEDTSDLIEVDEDDEDER